MTTNRPLRVFLCHSSTDKPAVRELYQKLCAEPWIQPWLDEEDIFPGDDWNFEIQKAIKETDAIIVCLSKGSITKEGYVQKEIKTALDYSDEKPERTVYIIPVRLEECKPPERLIKWQYADYFEGQGERSIKRLLVSLKRRAESIGLKIEESLPQENKPLVETSSSKKEDKIIQDKKPVSGVEKTASVLAESDLPAWLKSEDEVQKTSLKKSDLPAWMKDEDNESKTTVEASDLPAWLKSKDEVQKPSLKKSDLLAWMKDEDKESKTAIEASDLPAWLSGAKYELLNQAKSEIDRGNIHEALAYYGKLIKKGEQLEEIIRDLSEALSRYPVEIGLWQTLGDANMRANRLKEATEAYDMAEKLIR